MPRPKVPPSQRRRAAEACNACREAKKRCTGTAPCTHCLRRGIEGGCFITYAPRGTLAKAKAASQARDRALSFSGTEGISEQYDTTPVHGLEAGGSVQGMDNGDFQPLSPSESRTDDRGMGSVHNEGRPDSSPSTTNCPRMLLNLRGERVYIGGAASISFLQTVRRLVSDEVGPSPFSHNEKSDTMLEIESPRAHHHHHQGLDEMELAVSELDNGHKLDFLQRYHAVTEAFLYILDPADIRNSILAHDTEAAYNSTSHLASLKTATLDMIIAIGAQCKSPHTAQTVGQALFRKAQRLAFLGQLEDPSMDMVRTFLLMAFYMLGECRRNTAFMYLGIATRAAVVLGLHSCDSFSSKADEMRLRLWTSVSIMDKLVSSLLGRPAGTSGIELGDTGKALLNGLVGSEDHATDCLVAAHGIVSIINNITSKLYDRKEIATPVVEEFLRDIERWKDELPKSVYRSGSSPSHVDQATDHAYGGALGSIHVSCIYYFAITLVTRPVLIATLTTQPNREAIHSPLTATCLDAAMYLAQTCADACSAGLLQGNMCIMKALVFAAGLILGFEIFAKQPVHHDIEAAFQGAQAVLAFLSPQSPQAAHYAEILSSLSNAILKRPSRGPAIGKSSYVSKIFSLDPASDVQQQPPQRHRQPWHQSPGDIGGQSNQERGNDAEVLGDWPEGIQMDDLFVDWESLDMTNWDGFPFVT